MKLGLNIVFESDLSSYFIFSSLICNLLSLHPIPNFRTEYSHSICVSINAHIRIFLSFICLTYCFLFLLAAKDLPNDRTGQPPNPFVMITTLTPPQQAWTLNSHTEIIEVGSSQLEDNLKKKTI